MRSDSGDASCAGCVCGDRNEAEAAARLGSDGGRPAMCLISDRP